MRRRRTKGNMVLEAALWIPVLVLLVVSMIQFGKITYVYYTLRKIVYSAARYISVQQGTDFCNPVTDANIQAAINIAITDPSTGQPIINALTADMLSITTECADPNNAGALGACNIGGCGGALGAQRPDYVLVSIPSGYQVTFRIPLLSPVPISLSPSVAIPFQGTAL
jgi:Flp pilus assembly protein TadG